MHPYLKTLIQQANAAIAKGAYGEAEAVFRTHLANDSDNADVLGLLVQLLMSLEQYGRAESPARRLSQIEPTIKHLGQLAKIQLAVNNFDDAQSTYAAIYNMDPTPRHGLDLAKVLNLAGRREEADHFTRTLIEKFPHEPDVALVYVSIIERQGVADALYFLERFCAVRSGKLFFAILARMTELRTCVARQSAGFDPNIAASWEDLIQWRDPEGLALLDAAYSQPSSSAGEQQARLRGRGSIAASQGRWDDADIFFTAATQGAAPTIVDAVTFDITKLRTIDAMSDADIARPLPSITEVRRAEVHRPTYYLSSNPSYFWRFTLPLLTQLSGFATTTAAVHIHLMDGDAEEWTRCLDAAEALRGLAISMTAEAPMLANEPGRIGPIYYHAIRYVRLYQHLMRTLTPTIILDVDAILNADPAILFSQMQDHDIAIHSFARALNPWDKVIGGCVGFSATPLGITFARLVAAYISYWFINDKRRWGLDQLALFISLAHVHRSSRMPHTRFLESHLIGMNQPGRGIINFISGKRKFSSTRIS